MTEVQAYFRRWRRAKPWALSLATVVCLALLALLTVAQVAHLHAQESDADHCPLCIAMHSAAPVAVMAAVLVMVKFAATVQFVEARAEVRYWHPKLFTRPPPDGC